MEIEWAFGLAAFAGFIRYIQRFTKEEDRPHWEWIGAGIAILTGGFVGALTLWLVGKQLSNYPGALHFGIAIAGYGGPLTLDFFWELCRDTLRRAAEKIADGDPKN